MGGIERNQTAIRTNSWMEVALPVMVIVWIHETLQTLHISQ